MGVHQNALSDTVNTKGECHVADCLNNFILTALEKMFTNDVWTKNASEASEKESTLNGPTEVSVSWMIDVGGLHNYSDTLLYY